MAFCAQVFTWARSGGIDPFGCPDTYTIMRTNLRLSLQYQLVLLSTMMIIMTEAEGNSTNDIDASRYRF